MSGKGEVTKRNADASVLVRFAYTRDAAGNPIAIERESGLGVYYYEYDALQRLAYEGQFVDAARAYENYYEYDPAGNRTLLRHGETGAENLTYYEYNVANELLTAHDKGGWTYFSYDQNGNTVQEQTPSYTRYYDWDGRDMMVGVRSTEPGWTDNVIRYDGLASRASLLDSGGLTYYTWEGIRVLKTMAGDGTLRQRQVHGQSPSAIPSVADIEFIESATGGLAAHPGRSKGAARYDVGLLAHKRRRPALTDATLRSSASLRSTSTSPRGSTPHRGRASPNPEPPNLPSPALPVQRRSTAHRHTRYDAFGVSRQWAEFARPSCRLSMAPGR